MSKVGGLIRRRPAASAVAALGCTLGVLLMAGGGASEPDDGPADDGFQVKIDPPPRTAAGAPAMLSAPAPPVHGRSKAMVAAAKPKPRPKRRRIHRIASVRPGARVALFDAPRGTRVAVLGHRTEFGSDRNLWIVRRRGAWLGVTTEVLPNGRLGWIRDDPATIRIGYSPWWIRADLSDRVVKLLRGERVVHTFRVSVGAPGSPTPPGRYSVTDGLTAHGLERFYGCCVLALSGHQPNLPARWIGGDRMAIHGTPEAVGVANSAGCLRASDADMRALFRRVPLGTPVLIRR